MTSEEAREWLRSIKDNYIHGGDEAFDNARREALDMAIKALEQQPCEDAISRQAVLDGLASIAKVKARSDAQKSLMGRAMFFVEKLPPVTSFCILRGVKDE